MRRQHHSSFPTGEAVGIVVIVRTLVVTVAPLLADLIQKVLRPNLTLDIVGVLSTRESLPQHLRVLAPDLLLLGLTQSETDAIALPLLATVPSAAILVVAPSGQHAWLYEMQPHRSAMLDLSVAALARALASRFPADASKG
jgi:DNA-binding NarL/FixJ family response regulator